MKALILFLLIPIQVVIASTNTISSTSSNNLGYCYFDSRVGDIYKITYVSVRCEISYSAKRSMDR